MEDFVFEPQPTGQLAAVVRVRPSKKEQSRCAVCGALGVRRLVFGVCLRAAVWVDGAAHRQDGDGGTQWPGSLYQTDQPHPLSSVGINAALVHGLSNTRIESANNKLRLLTRLAFGFYSPGPNVSLALLKFGGPCPPIPAYSGAWVTHGSIGRARLLQHAEQTCIIISPHYSAKHTLFRRLPRSDDCQLLQ